MRRYKEALCEDIKGTFMRRYKGTLKAPEIGPKCSGTFEKQAPDKNRCSTTKSTGKITTFTSFSCLRWPNIVFSGVTVPANKLDADATKPIDFRAKQNVISPTHLGSLDLFRTAILKPLNY